MITIMDQEGCLHNYETAQLAKEDFNFRLLSLYQVQIGGNALYYHEKIRRGGYVYQGIAARGMIVYMPEEQRSRVTPREIIYIFAKQERGRDAK